jgi:hypothetical protein
MGTLTIHNIDAKWRALQAAESCMMTIKSMKEDALDPSLFALISDIKMDYLDIKEAQEGFDEISNL